MLKTLLPSLSAAFILSAAPLLAQTLAFEVASIKPSEPITPAMVSSGKLHAGMKIDGKRVDIGNFGLLQVICKAYDVKAYQVEGPAWLKANPMTAQRFDIIANLPDGATKEQVPEMLQTLLKERFKLVVRKESKDQPVYSMVVGKGGLKLKPTPEVAASPDAPAPNPAVTGSSSVSINQTKGGATVSDGQHSQKMTMAPDGKSMKLEISGTTLAELAEGITPLVDRPIIDNTETKGKFDVTMDLSMEDLMNAARAMGTLPAGNGGDASKPAELASDPGGRGIFNTIQGLGLKLEPRKLPLAMVVVESMEKMPTEN